MIANVCPRAASKLDEDEHFMVFKQYPDEETFALFGAISSTVGTLRLQGDPGHSMRLGQGSEMQIIIIMSRRQSESVNQRGEGKNVSVESAIYDIETVVIEVYEIAYLRSKEYL